MKTFSWRRFTTGAAIWAMSATAQAQSINLYDLIGQAENNYPQLRQRQAELAFSQAHELTVKSLALPGVVLADQPDLGTANAAAGAYFPLGIIPSLSGGATGKDHGVLNQGNIAVANVNWDLYDFGFYRALNRLAKAKTEISRSVLAADRYAVRQQVVLYYIDWLRKYRLLQIRQEDMQRDSVVLSLIRANVRSGLRPGADSSTALATYSGARVAYLGAGNDYEIVMDRLTGICGVALGTSGPDTAIAGNRELEKLAVLAAPGGVAAGHPELDVLVKRTEAQREANIADEKRFLPRLQLSGAYWVRNSGISSGGQLAGGDGLNMPYSAVNYAVGVTAAVNLTDFKLRHDHKAENSFLLDATGEALKNEQLELNTLYTETQTSMRATASQLRELPVLQQAASMAFQQQLALYRAGLNTLTDVSNAEYTLLQAETNFVITQTEMLRLTYLLASLDGNQESFIQHFKR